MSKAKNLLIVLFIAAVAMIWGTHSRAQAQPPPPAPAATPTDRSAMFSDPRYYYRAFTNNPKLHPVPVDHQTGGPRDWHLMCYDWERLLRTGGTWTYFVTSCECYPAEFIRTAPSPPASSHP